MQYNPFNSEGSRSGSKKPTSASSSTKTDGSVSTSDSSDDDDLLKNLAETLVGGNKPGGQPASPVRALPQKQPPMRLTRFKKEATSSTNTSPGSSRSPSAPPSTNISPATAAARGKPADLGVISPLSLKSDQQPAAIPHDTRSSKSPSPATSPTTMPLTLWSVDTDLTVPLRHLLKETRSQALKIAADEEGPADLAGEVALYGATRKKWEQLLSGISAQHSAILERGITIARLEADLRDGASNNGSKSPPVTPFDAANTTLPPGGHQDSSENLWHSAVMSFVWGISNKSSHGSRSVSNGSSSPPSPDMKAEIPKMSTPSNAILPLSELIVRTAIDLSSANNKAPGSKSSSVGSNQADQLRPSSTVDVLRQLEKYQTELLELRHVRDSLFSSQQDKASTIEERSLELITSQNDHNEEMRRLKEEVGEMLQRSAAELEESKEALGQLQIEYDDLLVENQSLKAALGKLSAEELKSLNETFTTDGSPARSLIGSPPKILSTHNVNDTEAQENNSDSTPLVGNAAHHISDTIPTAKHESIVKALKGETEELLAALVALKAKVADDEAETQDRIAEMVNKSDLGKQVQSLQATIEHLKAEVDEKNSSFSSQKDGHANEILALNMTIIAIKSEITEKEDKIAELEQTIDGLKMQIEQAENATEDLKDERQKLQDQLDELRNAQTALNKDIGTEQMANLEKELLAAKAMTEELEHRLNNTRSELIKHKDGTEAQILAATNAHTEELASLGHAHNEADELRVKRIAELEHELKSLQDQLREQKQKYDEHLNSESDIQKIRNTEDVRREDELKSQLAAASAMVEELDSRLNSTRREVSNLQSELGEAKSRQTADLAGRDDELTELARTLDGATQSRHQLEAELESLREELTSEKERRNGENNDSHKAVEKDTFATATADVDQSQTHIRELETENKELRAENYELNQKLEGVNEDLVTKDQELTTLRSDIFDLRSTLQNIHNESEAKPPSKIEALEAEIAKLRNDHLKLMEEEDIARESAAEHVNELAENDRLQQAEISRLNQELAAKSQEFENLKDQLHNGIDDGHKSLYEQSQEEIIRLKAVVSTLEITLHAEQDRCHAMAIAQGEHMSHRELEKERILHALDGTKAEKTLLIEKMSQLEKTNSELSSQILRENDFAKSGRSSEVGFDSLRREYDSLQDERMEMVRKLEESEYQKSELQSQLNEYKATANIVKTQLIALELNYRSTIDEKDKVIASLSQAIEVRETAEQTAGPQLQQQHEALDNLATEVNSLKEELHLERQNGNSAAAHEIEALKDTLHALKDDYTSQIARLKESELELKTNSASIQSELTASIGDLAALQEENKKLNTGIIPKLNSQISELNDTVAQLRLAQQEQSASIEKELEQSLTTISQLNEKVKSLEKIRKDLDGSNQLLKSEKEELITALRKSMDSGVHDEALTAAKEEISDLQRRLESAERALSETETEHKAEKGQAAQLRKDLQKLKNESEHQSRETTTKVRDLEDQLKQAKAKVAKLSTTADGKDSRHTSEIEALQAELTELRKECKVYEQQIANMEGEIDTLKRKLVSAQRELKDTTDELKIAQANAQTNGDLEKRVAQLQQEISDAENTLKAATDAKHASEAAVGKHRRTISAAKADLETMSADNASLANIRDHLGQPHSSSLQAANSSLHSNLSVGRQRSRDLPTLRAAQAAANLKENDSIAILSRQLSDAAKAQNLREKELQRARHEIEALKRQLLVTGVDVSNGGELATPSTSPYAPRQRSPSLTANISTGIARSMVDEDLDRRQKENRERLKEHIFALEKQLRMIKQDTSDVQLARMDAELDSQQLADELSRLEVQIATLKAENIRIREEKESFLTDFRSKIEQLETDLNEKKGVNTELQSHNTKLQTLLQRRSEELILSEEVVNDLEGKLTGRDKDFSHTRRQLNDAMATVRSLESENDRLAAALEHTKVEVLEARKKISDVKLSHVEYNHEAESLRTRVVSQERAIDHLKADLHEAESLSAERSSALSRAQRQKHDEHSRFVTNVEEVYEELATAKEALIALKADLKEAQLSVSQLQNDLRDAHAETKTAEAKFKESHIRLTELTAANNRLKKLNEESQESTNIQMKLESALQSVEEANAALAEELEQSRLLVARMTETRAHQDSRIETLEATLAEERNRIDVLSVENHQTHDNNLLSSATAAATNAESKLAAALADNELLMSEMAEMKRALENTVVQRANMKDQLAALETERDVLRHATNSAPSKVTTGQSRSRSPSMQSVASSTAAEFKVAAEAIGTVTSSHATTAQPTATSAFLIRCIYRFLDKQHPVIHHDHNASLDELSLTNIMPEAVRAAEGLQRSLEADQKRSHEVDRLSTLIDEITTDNKVLTAELEREKSTRNVHRQDLEHVRIERDRLLTTVASQSEHLRQLQTASAVDSRAPPHTSHSLPSPSGKGTVASMDIGSAADDPMRPPFNASTKIIEPQPIRKAPTQPVPPQQQVSPTSSAAPRRQPVASPYRGSHSSQVPPSATGSRSASNATVPLLSNNSDAAKIAQIISDAMRNRDKVGPVNTTTSSHAAAAATNCPEAAATLLIIAPPLIEELISMHLAARADYNSYLEDCTKNRMKPTRVTTRGFELAIKQMETSLLYLKRVLTCALTYSDSDTTKNPVLQHPTSRHTAALAEGVLESFRVFIVTVVHISNTFCDPLPVEEVLLEGFVNTLNKHLKNIDGLESKHHTTLVAAASQVSSSRSASQQQSLGQVTSATTATTQYSYYRQPAPLATQSRVAALK